MKHTNKIRIIGGQWKRRNLPFIPVKNLRPSPDSVRETLFNWLQANIVDADCLDLFAGSGALGFEAISRGANSAILVEKNAHQARQLQQNKQLLETDKIEVIAMDAFRFLQHYQGQSFNLIFLDPPFEHTILPKVFQLLIARKLIAPSAKIYVERQKSDLSLLLPENWHIIRQTTCGLVQSFLISTSRVE